MYGVIVSESSMNKYNIFADPLCFEIRNRRQGPKTAGYRRKPAANSNPGRNVGQNRTFCKIFSALVYSGEYDCLSVHYI